MPRVNVLNQQGEEIGTALLPKEIFDVKLNPDLVHQVVVSQMANRRQVIADVKDRSAVSGGGKKPWRQKGTGRARHGSSRSPLWRGGGVTFGPSKERVFKKKINIKMRRQALFMVLSGKVKDGQLVLLDKLEIAAPKTKLMAEIFKKLPCQKERTLIALPEFDKKVFLSARNLPKVKTVEARNLNAMDLLNYKYLLMLKESTKAIKETFLKGDER